MSITVLVTIGITAAMGDVFIFRWSRTNAALDVLLAIGSWTVSLVLFGLLLRWTGRPLGLAFVLVAAIHTILILLWDRLVEKTTWTWMECAGVALALFGALLIEIGHAPSPGRPDSRSENRSP